MTRTFRGRRKKELHALLGNRCTRCGETNSDILQVDHVYNNGHEERKLFPDRDQYVLHQIRYAHLGCYTLLCASCNWEKEVCRREMKPFLSVLQE